MSDPQRKACYESLFAYLDTIRTVYRAPLSPAQVHSSPEPRQFGQLCFKRMFPTITSALTEHHTHTHTHTHTQTHTLSQGERGRFS